LARNKEYPIPFVAANEAFGYWFLPPSWFATGAGSGFGFAKKADVVR
jgi:hypothetical protein